MLTKVYLYTLTHVNLHTFINPLNAASVYIHPQLTIAHRAERIYMLSRNTIPPQPYKATGAAHLYRTWKLGSSLFIPCFCLRKLQSHVLCFQNGVPCLLLELLVSLGPCPHQWFCAFKTATLAPQLQGCVCPRPHLWFCASKTVYL